MSATDVSPNTDIRTEASLISRMERLPLNRKLYGIIGILTWCYVLEAFDLGLIGQVVAVLKKLWNLDPSQVGILGSCSTFGVIIGTACAGRLADKYGRKRVLLWGTFIFTFFTLLGALFANYYWIVCTRFIAGLGSGAVFPQPYLMISEIAPPKYRGRLFGICNGLLGIAYLLPTFTGAWALNALSLEYAWRLPFILGGLPFLTLFWVNKHLPESPRWLILHGQSEKAEEFVRQLEKSSGVESDTNYCDPAILASLEQSRSGGRAARKISWSMLFKPPYLSRTLVSYALYSVTLITWYVVMVYMPVIIADYGVVLSSAVALSSIFFVSSAVGSMSIGPVADKLGRKPATTIFIGIAIISFFALPSAHNTILLLLLGCFAVCFGNGTNAIFKVYIAEQYPTDLRGMGVGAGEAVARFIGGVLATYLLAFILNAGGISSLFYFLGIANICTVSAMWIWGRETAGVSVETASAETAAKEGEAE